MLDGTNSVFARLMTEAVGGIRYDSAAALYLGADMPEPEAEGDEEAEAGRRAETPAPACAAGASSASAGGRNEQVSSVPLMTDG